MKKILLTTLTAIFIASCGSKPKQDYAILAGEIENSSADSVFVIRDNDRHAIAIENGVFKDTIHLTGPTYFQFYSERERTDLFLAPGDSVFLTTNMEQFDQDLKYSGTLAAENNFLAKKVLDQQSSIYSDPSALFSVAPTEFQQKLLAFQSELKTTLKNSGANEVFQTMETKNLDHQYHMMLLQYPMAHAYFTQSEEDFSEIFEEELNQIPLNNEADFLSIPAYKDFVVHRYTTKIEQTEDLDAIEKMLMDQPSPAIKDALMKEIWLYNIGLANDQSERYFQFIQKESKDEALKKEAQELFEVVKKILPGNPSPNFDYPNVSGEKVALSDFKGKLVYIDVWATWCGPCIREIPSLKALAEDYKDQDLAIVSISIDPAKDHGKWLNMVKEKDLQGYQIFADKDWKSDFVTAYNIKGIPRFILLDKEGKIIQADAPRPSDSEIRTLFDQHL